MSEKLSRTEKAELMVVFAEALERHRQDRLRKIADRIHLVCLWVTGVSLLLISLCGVYWWLKNGAYL